MSGSQRFFVLRVQENNFYSYRTLSIQLELTAKSLRRRFGTVLVREAADSKDSFLWPAIFD